jgi:hypothetical protein
MFGKPGLDFRRGAVAVMFFWDIALRQWVPATKHPVTESSISKN